MGTLSDFVCLYWSEEGEFWWQTGACSQRHANWVLSGFIVGKSADFDGTKYLVGTSEEKTSYAQPVYILPDMSIPHYTLNQFGPMLWDRDSRHKRPLVTAKMLGSWFLWQRSPHSIQEKLVPMASNICLQNKCNNNAEGDKILDFQTYSIWVRFVCTVYILNTSGWLYIAMYPYIGIYWEKKGKTLHIYYRWIGNNDITWTHCS